MKIEVLNVADIIENPNNARTHNEAQIDALIQSLKLYSQYRPIVIDENNMLLAGHAIILAKKKMGEETVDAYRIKGLSEKEKKKLLIVDNKIQDMGWDDYEKVEDLVRDIGEYELPGFDEDFLKSILSQTSEQKEEYFNEKEGKVFGTAREPVDSSVLEGSTAQTHYDGSDFDALNEPKGMEVICPHCGQKILVT